ETIYHVLPVFYESLADAMEEVYGARPAVPCVLRFGSWVGGDMDGNPNVGADTIAATLAAQRSNILRAYRNDLSKLSRTLSQSSERVDIGAAVHARIATYHALFPDT